MRSFPWASARTALLLSLCSAALWAGACKKGTIADYCESKHDCDGMDVAACQLNFDKQTPVPSCEPCQLKRDVFVDCLVRNSACYELKDGGTYGEGGHEYTYNPGDTRCYGSMFEYQACSCTGDAGLSDAGSADATPSDSGPGDAGDSGVDGAAPVDAGMKD